MRLKRARNKTNYIIRYKTIKSKKDRLVIRFTNRQIIVQIVKGGFNKIGDEVVRTWLSKKCLNHGSINVALIPSYVKLIYEQIPQTMNELIIDLGGFKTLLSKRVRTFLLEWYKLNGKTELIEKIEKKYVS
jgi:ribosomal protein L18